MLQDKDRIFTNIYGFHDWGLKGALARGQWNGTKGFIDNGRDWVIEQVKASGLRGREQNFAHLADSRFRQPTLILLLGTPKQWYDCGGLAAFRELGNLILAHA